jgi:hypothetical protein
VGLKLELSGLWQAGLSKALLRNGVNELATVDAVRLHAPFNLKVDGPNPGELKLRLTDGQPFQLRLHNTDAMAYRFQWRLELPGLPASGVAVVGPNRSVTLPLPAASSPASWLEAGFLRSASLEGRLVLEHEPDPSLKPYPLQRQIYPVQASFSWSGPVWQRVWNTGWIVGLLLIGIAASLLLNYALPMQRRRVAAKQRLALLEGRLAGLGAVVPARILSLLRVEKRRLREELRQLWPIDPTTEAALPKFEAQIDWIDRRITLVATAGEHLTMLDGGTTPLAVPQADLVRQACRTVFEVVAKHQAADEDIKQAQTALLLCADLRAAAAQPPTAAMLQALADTEVAVRQRIALGADPTGHEAAFKALVAALLPTPPIALPAALSGAAYADRALAVAKAEVVADFRGLLAAAESAEVRTHREARAVDLLAALCPGPDESLARARWIVLEAEQAVSAADLVAALGQLSPGDLWIDVDPPKPLPYQLVALRVRLRQAGLDHALARCQIECVWRVTGGEIESDDWVASYFFEAAPQPGWFKKAIADLMQRDRPIPISIEVGACLRHRGQELATVPPATVVVEPAKSYFWASAWLSLGALFATMLIVGIGLIAGAQEKIQSLDWAAGVFAVLALGFGADALKRVLTKP